MQTGRHGWGKAQESFLPPTRCTRLGRGRSSPPPTTQKPAVSLTHDLLCVLSLDTWWNFGHELEKKIYWDTKGCFLQSLALPRTVLGPCERCEAAISTNNGLLCRFCHVGDFGNLIEKAT